MKKLLTLTLSISLIVSAFFLFGSDKVVGSTLNLAGTTYNLSGSGISSSATSITLQSLTIPQTGALITDAMLSDTFYVTLEPGSKTKQEIVSCTTATQNSGGTATLSGCTRGLLPFTPFTASTTYQFVHAGGSQVIFSDPPQLFELYVAKANTETITGLKTFSATTTFATTTVASSTISNLYSVLTRISSILNAPDFTAGLTVGSGQSISWSANNGVISGVDTISGLSTPNSSETTKAANVAYVNNLTNQGAATATDAIAGIARLSVAAVDVNNPIVVGDNDTRLNSVIQIVSTTTTTNVATATLSSIPAGGKIELDIYVASTTQGVIRFWFNEGFGSAKFNRGTDYSAMVTTNNNGSTYVGDGLLAKSTIFDGIWNACDSAVSCKNYAHFTIYNSTTTPKFGTGSIFITASTTSANPVREYRGSFQYATTTQAINSVSVAVTSTATGNGLGIGTIIKAYVTP